ncbi:divergent polysaccharide deacetylase [Lucifera butyrica]|uniref:Divergent polysaccharide deacetylase n=1 Tax=Lucifera butyrica TaxID=1351585 RepID=A0A498R405_9FIRM|nr:divergent polysaccharide deacetylase family protein [Lucifera butyrica]VBB05875.1 divergent polysaccharide deacetylase [Lucifera butyrica]
MAKRSSRKGWILLGMALLAAILYFQLPDKEKQDSGHKYNTEKTGAGVVADFSAATNKIHSAVDQGMQKAGLSVKDVKDSKREVPRKEVEGTIRWTLREVLAAAPANASLDNVQSAIQSAIKAAGGEVFAAQPDTYKGMDVLRMDIGLKDTLAGDPVTMIAEKVYIAQEKVAGGKTALVPEKKTEVRPPAPERAKMAIIIDDFGYNQEPIGMFASMGRPLTFSVLPYHIFSNEAASRGLAAGQQVMLHLPMEPMSASVGQEKTSIQVAMSDAEIRDIVTKAIQSVPGIVGVNNHEGSRATADPRVMKAVLGVIKNNDLFFIDSRTSSRSVAFDMAKQTGVPTGENSLFIDNSSDIAAIKEQLQRAAQIALRYGSIIVIGHARSNTAIAIREAIPDLEADGIRLVFVSQLVK